MTPDYLTFLDILPALFWFVIIIISAILIRGGKKNQPEYKYYIPNILVKMFFATAYGVFYIYIYGGGDTIAYFDTATTLNNLFFKSPEMYFQQMTSSSDLSQLSIYYDSTTGFPPSWIYKESEGFFVAKIISTLSFFTLKSYFAMTLIIATITSHASWKVYKLVRSYSFNHEKLLVVGVLFLPSVNFWCSGISKDSIVFIASMYLIYNAFKIISKEHKSKFNNYVMFVLMAFLIYHIRSFVLVSIIVPLLFSISARVVKSLGGGNMAVVAFRTVIIIIGILGVGRSFILQSEEDFLSTNSALQEASVIQKDFQSNDTYGNKKYDLGNVEFTSFGLLKVMPLAIITGIFRPFIWEALSPTLIMNGLESLIFLYFTYFFFRNNFMKKWSIIRGHEFLIFCLIFIIIIGFMTGMTSILYGVLVRLRSPLLPFLFILLTLDITNIIKSKEL